ncbi:MAG: DNA-protecting protein DprA [Limnobacter sp.]|jgi:DNA processing protein|uniref:DNA-processing protein DprA n=1 Tax=Limnobacter sp. TaxID=2003368 RepID=UPI001207BDE9|nr:DNA-processing protein DprA [Limnobacter sp.]MDZ4051296.1 DNA-processing protein DprA [Limnobacter sp.]RZO93668.1 MAG: DNA-protecting protein DprA [Limnobacter sp.]
MGELLNAMNLAYNTTIKARVRYELAQQGPGCSLPAPCEAVRLWHALASTWLLQSNKRFWVGIHSLAYPQSLLALKDPPLILFGEGRLDLLKTRGIAIVGSRNATRTGLSNAHGFGKAFAQAQWVVVSGLAEGIDGAAHAGALQALGATIAVLGCGPDEVYPPHHAGLKKQIVEQGGLVLSEYPPGTAPQAGFFPRRNRIIAGLADALLVIEAAMRSGSLITARVASELGRPVGAIPGSIHSSQSKGCHDMIKKGALLVETALELMEEAKASLPQYKLLSVLQEDDSDCHTEMTCTVDTDAEPDEELGRVLQHLGHDPVHTDTLARQLGLDTEDTLAALTELELLGLVLGESGNRWVRSNGVF